MRILAISDTHLGYQSGRTSKGRQIIYNNMFQAFKKILPIAREEKIDWLLLAGDFFNRPSPRKKTISEAYQLVESLLEEGIGFIAIAGNHDRSRLAPSLLTTFYKNKVFFLNRLKRIDLGDISVVGFPYDGVNPQKNLKYAIKLANRYSKTPTIILCHQIFQGASFGPHHYEFSFGKDVIRTNSLPKNIRFIISGHIHQAQALNEGNILYTGSLERTSFVEVIEPKGLILINIYSDSDEVKFRKVPSFPMQVLETDLRKNSLDLSKLEDSISKECRTLLRFTGVSLSIDEIQKIQSHFSSDDWPWLHVSPNLPNKYLKPLYNQYKGKFRFNMD